MVMSRLWFQVGQVYKQEAMKLLILQGLPGSGKSTWAKRFVKDKKGWVRVNRDDLRNMRGDYWLPEQEDLINGWERSCVSLALTRGLNVILDATNLSQRNLKRFLSCVTDCVPAETLEIEYKFFDVPVEECIRRDSERDTPVGSEVILSMHKKHILEL